MHELGIFIGRFHPVWVHLPIGILLLLGLLEVVGLLARSPGLSWLPTLRPGQRTLILSIGAFAAVVAAALGWILARTGEYDLAQVSRHQWLGIAAASAAVGLLVLHRVKWAYGPLLAGSLILLGVAAHAGGKITHGSDFLTEHMPPSLAGILGIAAPVHAKPLIARFDDATAYADVIRPILQERCVSCHGASKSNGDLRLDSWESLMKGGKHGLALKPGDPGSSLLVKRIELPVEEKEHMPPRGKPQLADDDLTLVEWWVATGAPRDTRTSTLDLPSSVEVILEGRLVGGAASTPPDRAATLSAAAQVAGKLGIIVRSISPDGPWLDVNARAAGKAFGDRELEQLAPIAPAVVWLDLGGTSVTDEGLAALHPMKRLERLHLDGLKVTDVGLARISRQRQLVYLNLRGTLVTDRGLVWLRTLPRLRSLYVWQTAVSPAAVQALGDQLVDKRRIARWKQDKAELERRINEEQFEGNTGEELRAPANTPASLPPDAAANPNKPKATP